MKKVVQILLIAFLIGCEDTQTPSYMLALLPQGTATVETKSEPVIEATATVQPTEEEEEIVDEEPAIEPSPYLLGYIYLVDKDQTIVYSGLIESNDTINAYNTQSLLMNQFGDPLCPCTVIIGSYVVQAEE